MSVRTRWIAAFLVKNPHAVL